MAENFQELVPEVIRQYFEDELPNELEKATPGRTKYTKNYFDKVEKEIGGGKVSDDLTK